METIVNQLMVNSRRNSISSRRSNNSINTLNTQMDDVHTQMDSLNKELKKLIGKNSEVRTYDGSANNLANPTWGAVGTLLRKSSSDYADGISTLAVRGLKNTNPRVISNSFCGVTGNPPLNEFGLSDMTWVWGQFVDHEITLTPSGDEKAYIETETKINDPNETYPEKTIFFDRSKAVVNQEPREQPNVISAYVDATNIYGSSSDRAFALRNLNGRGTLKTSIGDNKEILLPYNIDELENASLPGQTPSDLFISGDIRANENVVLIAMHTLFMREHNRLCKVITDNDPSLIGKEEIIFQKARKIVSGIEQKITYDEYLPALLGSNNIEPYTGYNQNINAGIKTEFSTVGYRLGHSMLSSNIKVGTNPSDDIKLKDAFFKPGYVKINGIEQLLLGASKQKMKKINNFVIDDVRNFLFGPPTTGHLLDLVSLNIQRGRDHGIPGYNAVREAYGLLTKNSFVDITNNITITNKLAELYDTPNDIDPWVGMLCEDNKEGSAVGELTGAILKEQFRSLRNGDRFWYQNDKSLTEDELSIIETSTLSKVIQRNINPNTSTDLLPNVFKI